MIEDVESPASPYGLRYGAPLNMTVATIGVRVRPNRASLILRLNWPLNDRKFFHADQRC
jgi:hypothetical protein